MFKMMDKFYDHLEQWRKRYGWRYKLVKLGLFLTLLIGTMYLSYMISPSAGEIRCFSGYTYVDIALISWLCLVLGYICIIIAWAFHVEREEKKAKQRLKNRELSDYVKKYEKYVAFMEHALQEDDYVLFSYDDLLRQFDDYLTKTAYLCQKQERRFTDFEVMACLMYALTYETKANILFAFHCAKAFLCTPNVYQCIYIEGDELILEPKESLQEVSFEKLDDSTLLETQKFIGVYLSRRENYSQILELADFLHIFYLRCAQ